VKPPTRAVTRSRWLVFGCGTIPVLLAALLALYRPVAFAGLDAGVYDTVVRMTSTRQPAGRIVIIDVDERSLAKFGQWPWKRDLIALLVDTLRKDGAAVVALDIMFPEADRYVGPGDPFRSDAVLAATLRQGRVVLGYGFTFEGGVETSDCVLHPVHAALVQAPHALDHSPYFHGSGAVCSLPLLAEAAQSSGFMNAAPDPDGILRRAPLLIEYRGEIFSSLAVSAVRAANDVRDVTLRVSNVNAATVWLDREKVPVDGRSNLLLRYRGKKHTFPYVSAADVLTGQVSAGKLRDKIVFIGTNALGTREVVATPLDTLFAGVEVQATVADNLLQGDFVRRPDLGNAIESYAAVTAGVAVALLVARVGLVWGAVGITAVLGGLWIGAVWLVSSAGIYLSPLLPTFGSICAIGVMTLAKFSLERQRADTASNEKKTAQRLMVQSLLSLTEIRDANTGSHSRRTQFYARLLGEQLAAHPRFHAYLTPERIELLSSLAPLHDIGKVGVPDSILNKQGPLNAEELAEMRRHPIYGRDVIMHAERDAGARDDEILELAKDIVYTHHEKWDGSGYPQGLSGEDIPIAGRLMALVDVYDACTTRDLYARSMPHGKAAEMIASHAGTHFDPAVVEAFLRVADVFDSWSHEGSR
jgi:CHASE2 domain-containing sensor protein